MAQLGKHLSCKLEDLISISRTHVKNKKLGMVAHALCEGRDRQLAYAT